MPAVVWSRALEAEAHETKQTSVLFLSIALGAIRYQSLKANENKRNHQKSP
jgi:hypothetical protein